MAGGHLGTIWASIALDTAPLGAGTARARRMLYGLSATADSAGKGIGSSLASAFVAVGKVAVVAGAVVGGVATKMAIDFDSAIRKAGSVAEASNDQMQKWGKEVLSLSKKFPQSATEIAQALYWIKSDMPDASDAEQFKTLEIALKGAVAGVADLEDATEALIVVQNAYKGSGVELQDAASYMDVMNVAVQRGSLTLQDFVSNMGKATGTAAMAKVPFQEIAAAASTLTRKGVPVETAFMAINQAMMTFLKPSKEASDLAQELGLDFTLTGLRAKGLAGSLMEIAEKVPDEQLAELFPNIRALKAVLPLAGVSTADFAKDLEEMGKAAGTTGKMFDININSMESQLKIAMNKIKAPLIELGYKIFPYLQKALDAVVRIVEGKNEAWNSFAGTIKTIGAGVWNLASAIIRCKPLLIGLGAAFAAIKIGGMVATSIEGLSKTITTFAAAAASAGGPLAGGKLAAILGGIASSAASIALPVAIAAAGLGAWLYQTNKAVQDTKKMQENFLSFDRTLGESAIAVQPLLTQMEQLKMKLATLTPDTQEYVDTHRELLEVQKQIAGTMPGLIKSFDMSAGFVKTDTAALQRELEIRKRLGQLPETEGALGFGGEVQAATRDFDRLSTETGDYAKTVGKIAAELKRLDMRPEGIEAVQEAFFRSSEEGWTELNGALKIYQDSMKYTPQLGIVTTATTAEAAKSGKLMKGYREELISDEENWNKRRIKNNQEATVQMLSDYQKLIIGMEQLRVSARAAGEAKEGAPSDLISALSPEVTDPFIRTQAQESARMYIEGFFQDLYKGSQEEFPQWVSGFQSMLMTGQWDAAFQQAAEQGSTTFVTSWVGQMSAQQVTIAATTNRIPLALVNALNASSPGVAAAASKQIQGLIAMWANQVPSMVGKGQQIADAIAKGLSSESGVIAATGDAAMDNMIVQMANKFGILPSKLDPTLQAARAKLEELGQLEVNPQIKVETQGAEKAAELIKGILVRTKSDIEEEKPKVDVDTSQADAHIEAVKSNLASIDDKYVQVKVTGGTQHFTVSVTASPTRTFEDWSEAGAYAGSKFTKAMQGAVSATGGVTLPLDVTKDVEQLTSLWESYNKTMSEGTNVNWVKNQLNLEVFGAISHVAEEAGKNAKEAELGFRNLYAWLDKSKVDLQAIKKEVEASDKKLEEWQHQVNLIQSGVQGWTDANGKLHESLDVLRDRLTKLQNTKITGETVASDESFALQQKINELQLGILQAEREYNYEKAAQLTLQKDELTKQKEILDLQTQVTYDPQRREIEKLLDTTSQQEMSYQDIIAAIKATTSEIQIGEAEHKRISDLIAIERENTYQLRLEYQLATEAVQELGRAIDEMGQNAVQRWEEMKRAFEEAQRAQGGGPGYAYGGPVASTGWAMLHAGEFVLSRAMLRSINQAKSPKLQSFDFNFGSTTVNVPVYLDGREVAKSTTRLLGKNASAYSRSGGVY